MAANRELREKAEAFQKRYPWLCRPWRWCWLQHALICLLDGRSPFWGRQWVYNIVDDSYVPVSVPYGLSRIRASRNEHEVELRSPGKGATLFRYYRDGPQFVHLRHADRWWGMRRFWWTKGRHRRYLHDRFAEHG